MREIEFRGIQAHGTKAGRWVYGSLVVNNSADDGYTHEIFNLLESAPENFTGMIYVDRSTVGQYTGMKDSEGTKVYEGDIFEALHDFGPGGFHKRIGSVGFHIEFGYQWNYWDIDNLVVIGNIHENPELLTKENGK